jgi:hypothetical protein
LMRELLLPLEAAAASDATGTGAVSVASGSADGISGVLRCLELCAADLQEEHIADALQSLMPLLHAFITSAQPHAKRERARAVRVLHKLLERMSTLCGDAPGVRKLERGPLAEWAGLALSTLAKSASTSLGADARDGSGGLLHDCSIEIALLRLIRLLVVSLPRSIAPHSEALLPALGALLLRAVQALEAEMHSTLDGASDAPAAYDSDGGVLGVSSLISCLLDVFASLAASSRFYKQLQPALPDVVHAVIALMQISPESEAAWAADLTQYLQDEDPDSFAVSVRVAAQQLLDELLDSYGSKALPGLLKACGARLEEAQALRASGAAHWWRLREGALLVLHIAAPLLGKSARQADRKGAALVFAPEQVLRDLLLPDASESNGAPPLLRARALTTGARLSPHLSPPSTELLLQACLAALAENQPAHLRLTACRALNDLCEGAPSEVASPAIATLLPAVVSLLQYESEDAVLLSLDAVGSLLRVNLEVAAAAEPWLAPLLLQLWSARHTEHLTASAVADAIRALAQAPAAVPALVQRLLPAIGEVLQLQHTLDSEHAAASATQAVTDDDDDAGAVDPLLPALEMLNTIVLRRWPPQEPLPSSATVQVLPLLLPVAAAAADAEIVRLSSSCLGKLVQRGALAEGGPALPLWWPSIERMLRPTLREEVVEGAVPLLGRLVVHAPMALKTDGQGILAATVVWLGRARLFGLAQAVLLALSQMVLSPHLGVEFVVAALRQLPDTRTPESLAAQHGGLSECALPFVTLMWAEVSSEVLHPYARKAIVAALLELVSPQRPELCSLLTAPQSQVDSKAGRLTRSGARRHRPAAGASAPPPMTPLVVRVFQLAVRVLSAAAAQAGRAAQMGTSQLAGLEGEGEFADEGGADDDDDDDNDDDDDDDDDDDEGGGADEAETEDVERHTGARDVRNRQSPFVSAESLSTVNLSDLLDEASDGDSDVESDGDGDDDVDAAIDPVRSVDLAMRAAASIRAFHGALGEQQFAQLCATLTSDADKECVSRLLRGS